MSYLLDSLRWLGSRLWSALLNWILPPSWVEAMGPDRTPVDGTWSMAAMLDAEGEALPPGNALDAAFPLGSVQLPTMHEIRRRYGTS